MESTARAGGPGSLLPFSDSRGPVQLCDACNTVVNYVVDMENGVRIRHRFSHTALSHSEDGTVKS